MVDDVAGTPFSANKSSRARASRQGRATAQATVSKQVAVGTAASPPINLQRIPLTSDPIFGANLTDNPQLLQLRQSAVSKVLLRLQNIQATIGNLTAVLANPLLPVRGVTKPGDELSLLYSVNAINSSIFGSMRAWLWNGQRFSAG